MDFIASDPRELDFFLNKYRSMLFIREFELIVGRKSLENVFQTPVHLGIGQEAIAIGISHYLRNTDAVFGNHRSHAHYLSMNGSALALMCEILGRAAGCSGGKGGSMHITSRDHGFVGSMPIVASTIPIAVGSALAFKVSGVNDISVSYFGDGASEEGSFHESLNFAAAYDLPVLFVCENNLFSSHMHIDERQSARDISRFAIAQGVKAFSVEGNNLLEVLSAAEQAITYIRKARKPAFIEAFTYRQFSHVGFDEDLDVGLNRRQDLPFWMDRDPLLLLETYIRKSFTVNDTVWLEILESTRELVLKIWDQAVSEAQPSEDALLSNVYWASN